MKKTTLVALATIMAVASAIAENPARQPKPGDADFPTQCGWGQPERHAAKVEAVKSGDFDRLLMGDKPVLK